jgi:hypothetical protein
MSEPVSLEQRRSDVVAAATVAEEAAAAWLEAHAAAIGEDEAKEALDAALRGVRGAVKRRERTERRLAKKRL